MVLRGVSADVAEVGEEQTSGSDRIVSGIVRNDQGEIRLPADGHLARQVQHPDVITYDAVPWPLMMMKRDKNLPVIDLGQKWVNVA